MVVVPLGGIAGEEEEQVLVGINIWVEELGLPVGEFGYEVTETCWQLLISHGPMECRKGTASR